MYFKPLFFDFPLDENTFTDTENTFLVGSGLKVSPFLTDKDSTSSYFPNAGWYSFPSGELAQSFNPLSSEGKYITFESGKDSGEIFTHMRSGYIIPYQSITSPVLTTHDLQSLPLQLYIAPLMAGEKLTQNGELLMNLKEEEEEEIIGFGKVYLDDGEKVNVQEIKSYSWHLITLKGSELTIKTDGDFHSDLIEARVNEIIIFGGALYKSARTACAYDMNQAKLDIQMQTSYHQTTNIFKIEVTGATLINMKEVVRIVWGETC